MKPDMSEDIGAQIQALIKDVPDFPKPGIVFKDITPVLEHGPTFQAMVQYFADRYRDQKIDAFVGIESRGFLLAAPVAAQLGAGMVLVRKPGKLPRETISQSYALEYGEDRIEMHTDSLKNSSRVVVFDDLLATGGTMAACCSLVNKTGATLVETSVIIELSFLSGRDKLDGAPCHALVSY